MCLIKLTSCPNNFVDQLRKDYAILCNRMRIQPGLQGGIVLVRNFRNSSSAWISGAMHRSGIGPLSFGKEVLACGDQRMGISRARTYTAGNPIAAYSCTALGCCAYESEWYWWVSRSTDLESFF